MSPAPNVLKIDVDGHEALALSGAHRVLEIGRPRILCEVGRENASTVTKILKEHRYLLFDAATARSERRELEIAAWNTIAYPRETL